MAETTHSFEAELQLPPPRPVRVLSATNQQAFIMLLLLAGVLAGGGVCLWGILQNVQEWLVLQKDGQWTNGEIKWSTPRRNRSSTNYSNDYVYVVQGRRYEGRFTTSREMGRGEPVKITYMANDPEFHHIGPVTALTIFWHNWFLLLLFGVLVLGALAAYGLYVRPELRRQRLLRERHVFLLREGHAAIGCVSALKGVGGGNYLVAYDFDAGGTHHVGQSVIPGPLMKRAAMGTQVTVVYDPNHPYHNDLYIGFIDVAVAEGVTP